MTSISAVKVARLVGYPAEMESGSDLTMGHLCNVCLSKFFAGPQTAEHLDLTRVVRALMVKVGWF
jgi:hypothetical protein